MTRPGARWATGFRDATVVVTGAGSGIGAGIARSFARAGAQVLVADIDHAAADLVSEAIVAEGGRAAAGEVDVASAGSVRALADTAFAAFGRVDVLCANAGVTLRPFRAIWESSAQDFEWIMRVNYLGVVHTVLEFVPRMRQQPGPKHLVTVSSLSSLVSAPGHGPYMASKAAVDSLSDSLRTELAEHGDDFGVTVVHPGNVRTRIGGSERLRPEDERSDHRDITAYPYRRDRAVRNDPLDPAVVGEMVTTAVAADLPYCLTHEAELSESRKALALRESSYHHIVDGMTTREAVRAGSEESV